MRKYVCFFNSKSIAIYADSSFEAQKKAALLFGVGRRTWMVHVYLADVEHVAVD